METSRCDLSSVDDDPNAVAGRCFRFGQFAKLCSQFPACATVRSAAAEAANRCAMKTG